MGFKELLKNVLDGEDDHENDETTVKAPEAPKQTTTETINEKKADSKMNTIQNNQNKENNTKAKIQSSLELKVVRPESFAAVGQIADHLLNGCTVVLNLEATTKETSRRIVDFLNGVAYSIEGDIKLVSANTYIITPNTVNMSGESATSNTEAAQDTADVESETPSFGGF